MYNSYMKPLIKYSIELPILNLKTFSGYKGGDILSIESSSLKTIKLIKSYCHNLEIDTNIKSKDTYTIFCHFGKDIYGTKDLDSDDLIYELKEDQE